MVTKVLVPGWATRLAQVVYVPFVSSHLVETEESFDSLKMHMLDVVSLARAWIAGGKKTQMDAGLLRNLVEANMENEGGGARHLSDDELLSDTFVSPYGFLGISTLLIGKMVFATRHS
jgi:hypothetical protein